MPGTAEEEQLEKRVDLLLEHCLRNLPQKPYQLEIFIPRQMRIKMRLHSPWINVSHYSTKEEAALREYEAIRELRPEFNVDVTSVFTCPPGWTDDMQQAFLRRHPLARFH